MEAGEPAADATATPRSEARPWHETAPEALTDFLAVLRADAAPEADALLDHLVARVQAQLSQMPDEAARRRLLEHVSHWACVARWQPVR